MSRNKLPVDGLLSWARREGDTVQVGLRLPGAELAPGPTVVRLTRRQAELRVDAAVANEPDAVVLAFTVPRSTLGPTPWSIALEASTDDRFQPVEARLLCPAGRPVAILPGPVPATKMPPPPPPGPGRAGPLPAVTPTRRALLRGRTLTRRTLGVARRAARRAGRKVSGGRGTDQPAERGDGPPHEPPAHLPGPVLRAVRAAGTHPVVVLTDPSTEPAVAAWLPALSDTDVAILRITTANPASATSAALADLFDLDGVERRLFTTGSPAVVMVALTPASLRALAVDHLQLFDRLFPHVRHGGAYIAHEVATGDPSGGVRDDAFETFRRAHGQPDRSSDLRSDPQVTAAREAAKRPGFVLLHKKRRHALQLREEQVSDVLPAREPGAEVSILAVRPAGTLQVAGKEVSHGPSPEEPWPDRLTYPEMTLRHYRGDFVSQGSMLLTADSTILPESFRWPQSPQLGNASIRAAGVHFSQVPRIKVTPLLDGDYYFLDCLFSGHFGHLLTEVVCRLWGWDAARSELPELKALFHTNPRRGRHGTLERTIFGAYGIPEADLVATDRPVRLRSVVGASPMWQNAPPFHVHPDLREVWERLTFGLLDGRPPADHERIFVSRGDDLSRRRCRNQAEVERFFADRGFHVFYPERLPLDEQVALFAGARAVAGFAGSAMFNMMHCRRLEKTIVISHNGYEARNENLFTSLLGGELHYFWQDSDLSPARLVGSKVARRASYAFDFEKYGTELARVIGEP